MKNILIVEDEEVIRNLYKRMSARMNCRQFFACTLAEAEQQIQTGDFAAIIADIKLPDGCGIEAVRSFKQKFPQAAVIIVTGSMTLEDKLLKASEAAGAELIFKPFRIDEILNILSRIFGGAQYETRTNICKCV